MPGNIFRFKRFAVEQSPSAGVKVGTDGVLLGAWCRVDASQGRLLDAGTGTGVIALMLAQRSGPYAAVDAVDIDPQCVRQAAINAGASPWAESIRVFGTSLQAFAMRRSYPSRQGVSASGMGSMAHWAARPPLYDHIVSNPPYFSSSLRPPSASRSTARHTVALTHGDLLKAVDTLLAPEGRFSVILPPGQALSLRLRAVSHGLFASRFTEVFTRPGGPCKRVLVEFVRDGAQASCECGALTIAGTAEGAFSDEYMALTRDFYLKF